MVELGLPARTSPLMDLKKKYGTILPGQGIGGVVLGMSRKEVEGVMGVPEEVSRTDFGDGSDSTSLDYPSLGLTFDFGSDQGYVLDLIRVECEDVQLFDRCLFDCSVEEVVLWFRENGEVSDSKPIDFVNDDGEHIVSYDFEGVGLTIWFVNNQLRAVQVGTLWADAHTPIFPWGSGRG